jgi:phosphatidylinositol 3-kinase
MANYFHWYVQVEISDTELGQMYQRLHQDFVDQLQHKTSSSTGEHDGQAWVTRLNRQDKLVEKLVDLVKSIRDGGVKHHVMKERVKDLFNGQFRHLLAFDQSVPLPVRPEQLFNGIAGDKAFVLKSALAPICLPFVSEQSLNPYKVLFKSGDDLRQDQFVIGLISLMDKLFKRVNLDLQLTPYRVLATSTKDGLSFDFFFSFVYIIFEKYMLLCCRFSRVCARFANGDVDSAKLPKQFGRVFSGESTERTGKTNTE